MVKKVFNKKVNKDNTKFIEEIPNNFNDNKKEEAKAIEDIKNMTDVINEFKKIKSDGDLKNKEKINLSSIYPYWCILQDKDGNFINEYGLKEETYKGYTFLVRKEVINGETKLVHCELKPEPGYDLAIIENNKHKIKKRLNILKQIKRKIEENMYENKEKKLYNLDIKDVNREILQLEINLHSIQYGKSYRYYHQISKNKIPTLIYEVNNTGLKLKKEVKENSLFAEASEVKKLKDMEIKKQVDETLVRKGKKDWLKIAQSIVILIFVGLLIWGSIKVLTFNEERSFNQCNERMDEMTANVVKNVNKLQTQYTQANTKEQKFQKDLIQQNKKLIDLFSNQNTNLNKQVAD